MKEVTPVQTYLKACPRCGQALDGNDMPFKVIKGNVHCRACGELLPRTRTSGTFIMFDVSEIFAPYDQ